MTDETSKRSKFLAKLPGAKKPPQTLEPSKPRNWLSAKTDQINERAERKAQEERNARLEAAKRGAEIVTDIRHQQVEYEKALARGEEDRIAEEIEVDRKGVHLAHKSLDFKLKQMEAETDHLTAEYNMRQSQAEAERERAEFEKAKYRQARQKLEGVEVSETNDREQLIRKKVDLSTEISVLEQQLESLLSKDGEQADAMRRSVEGQLEERRAELTQVMEDIQAT